MGLLTVPPIAVGAWSMALVLWQTPEYYCPIGVQTPETKVLEIPLYLMEKSAIKCKKYVPKICE